jgi:hypothetical protein
MHAVKPGKKNNNNGDNLTWKSQLITYQPLEVLMDSELAAFAHTDLMSETATHPIARLAYRLAALLLVAGNDPTPCRALPGGVLDAYSGASNCGFQV